MRHYDERNDRLQKWVTAHGRAEHSMRAVGHFLSFRHDVRLVKVKVPYPLYESVFGGRDVGALILKLGAKGRWVVDNALRPLYPLERSPISTE